MSEFCASAISSGSASGVIISDFEVVARSFEDSPFEIPLSTPALSIWCSSNIPEGGVVTCKVSALWLSAKVTGVDQLVDDDGSVSLLESMGGGLPYSRFSPGICIWLCLRAPAVKAQGREGYFCSLC